MKLDTFTFFDTEKALRVLTGISTHDGLWEAGFNLDDWDWGFVSDECYVVTETNEFGDGECVIDSGIPQYVERILRMMENYCVGFQYTEYNGKHYYMVYHS